MSLPKKHEVFLAFLETGTTRLHFDPRREGVQVPEFLRKEPHLTFDYGLNLPTPIPDLEVTELGVRATLSFARTPCDTVVPWSAVFAIGNYDGKGVLYQDDIPEDAVRVERLEVEGKEVKLGLVPASEDAGLEEPATERRKRPKLRLVK